MSGGDNGGKRALVIDDDAVMAEFASRVLISAGYRVDVCGDGMSALAQFRAQPYDAVVADVRMPRLSGLGFLMNLRLPPGDPCRVVLMSAMDDQKTRREALAAGAAAYLVKPFTSKDLLAVVAGASA